MTMYVRIGLIGAFALFTTVTVAAQTKYSGEGGVALDVPYVPTPQELVDRMLQLAKAGPDDIHYDLGSGDGRIVVTAVRDYKVKKGVGVDLDPVRVAEANENAKKAGVSDRVKFIQGDLFALDFTEATVLTMYLLPEVNLKLRPTILDKLKPGTRVVSHAFTMGDWQPDKHEVVDARNVYFWVVPAKVKGTWEWQMGKDTYRATLSQDYQVVSGTISAGGTPLVLDKPVIGGENITFEVKVPKGGSPQILRFSGKVMGDVIDATVDLGGQATKVIAKRVS